MVKTSLAGVGDPACAVDWVDNLSAPLLPKTAGCGTNAPLYGQIPSRRMVNNGFMLSCRILLALVAWGALLDSWPGWSLYTSPPAGN